MATVYVEALTNSAACHCGDSLRSRDSPFSAPPGVVPPLATTFLRLRGVHSTVSTRHLALQLLLGEEALPSLTGARSTRPGGTTRWPCSALHYICQRRQPLCVLLAVAAALLARQGHCGACRRPTRLLTALQTGTSPTRLLPTTSWASSASGGRRRRQVRQSAPACSAPEGPLCHTPASLPPISPRCPSQPYTLPTPG